MKPVDGGVLPFNVSHVRQQLTERGLLRYDSAFERFCLVDFLQDPDALIDSHSAVIVKHDTTSTVAIITSSSGEFVVKRHNLRSLAHTVRRAFKTTRATNSWRFALQLLHLGIRTPRPILALEKRYGPLRGKSYFVSEFQPGELALNLLPQIQEQQRLSLIADRILAAIQIMLDHNISHGDMKATNMIIHNDHPWFLDLDAMRRHRLEPHLMHAARRDKQRFLRNWQNSPVLQDLFVEGYRTLGI